MVSDLSGGSLAKLVIDATDEADLDRLAAALSASGPELIMVGSGGLAAALGRAWTQPGAEPLASRVDGRVLIAVSSLHPVTAGQLEQLASGPGATGADILTTSSEMTTAAAAADELAGRVVAALSDRPYAALVIVGGDGAAAVLGRTRGGQHRHRRRDHPRLPDRDRRPADPPTGSGWSPNRAASANQMP